LIFAGGGGTGFSFSAAAAVDFFSTTNQSLNQFQ
jgi:hypothetical protein